MAARPAHTAGIFADMSVDGPVIGTLVTVVDRAKNLPNRKTIGKQDPYCAARLGKEAKKTRTDVRGGQTPKWDQELRFTVHDSADYYQLKISVFTDDKKTDLIGESWIDLKSIIVAGGGQSDLWQGLTCRGKYAGEIRLEITFYDSREKPPKASNKVQTPTKSEQDSGSVKQRGPPKRRPLPSDPVTGEPPTQPSSAPPAMVSMPEHQQTPPRSQTKRPSHMGMISDQSPQQSMEYNTPPPQSSTRHQSYETYSPSPSSNHTYSHSTQSRTDVPRVSRGPRELYESPTKQYEDRAPVSQYDHQLEPRVHYQQPSLPEPYDPAPREIHRQAPLAIDQPPPPPAHRSRHGSGGPDLAPRNSYEAMHLASTSAQVPMRQDVLKQEAHRQSIPAYPGQPQFRGYESAPPASHPLSLPEPMHARRDLPRHHSYDADHELHMRAMQPTVEDVPETPSGNGHDPFYESSRASPYDERSYRNAPSPASIITPRSGGASPRYGEPSASHSPGRYDGSYGHPYSVSPTAGDAYGSQSGPLTLSGGRHSTRYDSPHALNEPPVRNSQNSRSVPDLPASLVPGMDASLSHEITSQIYEERRQDSGRYNASGMIMHPHGRDSYQPDPSYGSSPGVQGRDYPQANSRSSGATYSNGQAPPTTTGHRNVSPNPQPSSQRQILRKSVSPAPSPVERRRLSEAPFGPDSYDSLNPSVSRENSPGAEVDPDAKIITHDGREIDPSDHLPMDSWAPEPEPRQKKELSPEPRSRPSPAGAQPMPPSERRQLRVTARPHSMSTDMAQYHHQSHDTHTPPAPGSGGRQRLQKKSRHSAAPSHGSSPLAPISPRAGNYQETSSLYTPSRGHPRAGAWDYSNENHAPQYGSGPPLPAKVAIPVMSGANGGGDHALMEEMSRIDIGAGRSRRRGGY